MPHLALPLQAEMKCAHPGLQNPSVKPSQRQPRRHRRVRDAIGETRRRCPRRAGAHTPTPGTRGRAAASLTWPLPLGREEARQEQHHDAEEQREPHVCRQRGGALWGRARGYTCEEMYRTQARAAARGRQRSRQPPPAPGSHPSGELGSRPPAAFSSRVNDQAGARFLLCTAVSASFSSPFPLSFLFFCHSPLFSISKQRRNEKSV